MVQPPGLVLGNLIAPPLPAPGSPQPIAVPDGRAVGFLICYCIMLNGDADYAMSIGTHPVRVKRFRSCFCDTGHRRSGVMSDLVQSVGRAMTLLEAVAESPSGGAPVAVLADSCGLNRATAWRLLATLEAYGYVYSDPITHHYTLGLSVPKLAAASTTVGITWQAHAVLNRLSEKTGETADLAVSQGLALTYVAEVTPPA